MAIDEMKKRGNKYLARLPKPTIATGHLKQNDVEVEQDLKEVYVRNCLELHPRRVRHTR